MTRQTWAPLTRLPTTASLWSIEEYTSRIRGGEMLLDPPYQRGRRWSDQQRIDLMRSWLQGVPVPAVVLNERMSRTWRRTGPDLRVDYAVVDGRQRLETALAWQDGQLAVPASWLPADWIHTAADTDDGPYVRVTGLHNPRRVGRLMDLPCVRAQVGTVAAEAALYLLVNGAAPRSPPSTWPAPPRSPTDDPPRRVRHSTTLHHRIRPPAGHRGPIRTAGAGRARRHPYHDN